MNLKIEKLIQEATNISTSVYKESEGVRFGNRVEVFDKEKFAKLIIAKCIDICNELQDVPASEPRHCAGDIGIYFS